MRFRFVVVAVWLAGLVGVWAIVPAGPRRTLAGARYFVRFTPDGRQYVTLPPADGSHADTVAELWDVDTGRPAGVLPGPEPTTALTFSRDGQRVAGLMWQSAAPAAGRIAVWDRTGGGRCAAPVITDDRGPSQFSIFLVDDRTVVTHDRNGLILWNTPAPPRPVAVNRPGPRSFAVAAAISPDGTRLAVGWLTPEEENRLWPSVGVYDTATWRRRFATELLDRPAQPPAGGGAFQGYIGRIEFAPDGRTLAVAGGTNWGLIEPAGQLDRSFVCVLDAATGDERARLITHRGPAFTGDGRSLVSVRQTLTADELTATDLDTGQQRVVATYPRLVGTWGTVTPGSGWYAYRRAWLAWPTRIADGRILAVRTNDPPEDALHERLADWSARYLNRPIQPHLDTRLIDAVTGRELAALRTPFSMGDHVTIAPDGRTFAMPGSPPTTSPADGEEATVWDLPPRQPVAWLAAAAGGWTAVVLGLVALAHLWRVKRTGAAVTRV